MTLKDADRNASIEDLVRLFLESDYCYKTSLFWICNVCPDLSVLKLWKVIVPRIEYTVRPDFYIRKHGTSTELFHRRIDVTNLKDDRKI